MRKPLFSLCAAALASLLLSTGAQATSIPWGYSATSTEIHNNNTPLKTSSVKFNGSSAVATGDSGIIIYNLETTSTVDETTPDSFSNVGFDLEVTLTDIKAGGLGVPTGKVKFSGLYSASNVSKSSSLPDGNSWVGATKSEVTLGSKESGWRKYAVEIASFTPPGQPGGAPGSIQAVVRISDGTDPGGSGGGPPPNDVPEPASVVLAGLGLPMLLMARRRLKKAKA